MSINFNVEIVKFEKINEIQDAWNADDYIALMDSMGLGDDELKSMNKADLKEMCKMSLVDSEPAQAANYVLTYLIKDELTEGKIEQISYDMMEDRIWEQFADLSYHERFFNAYGLLRESFNGTFTQPTGVKLEIKISSTNKDDFEVFNTSLKAALVRLLSAGMTDNAVLNRLYDEKIASDNFSEAENILWQVKELSKSSNDISYEIISSEFWLGELKDVDTYKASTHADVLEEDEA